MSKDINKFFKGYSDSIVFGDQLTGKDRFIFSSGLLQFPYVIGRSDGIPGGSIIEILAEPKSGKTTMALDFVANAQKNGAKEIEVTIDKITRTVNAIWLDFEFSFDSVYARQLGVDVEKVLVVRTQWAESAFNIAEFCLADGIQIYVCDSIPMVVSKTEEDKDHEDAKKVATEALLIDRHIKRLVYLVDSADALAIIINQYRANFSMMSRKEKKRYGPRIIYHNSKLTIELIVTANKEDYKEIKLFIDKNKFGPSGHTMEYRLLEGRGMDIDNHILQLAIEHGIVRATSNGWHYYNDISARSAKQALDVFPMNEIKEKVKIELAVYYNQRSEFENGKTIRLSKEVE